jgi:copper(I)-binding protein
MPNKTSLNYLAPIIFLALFTAVACIAPTAPTPEYEPIADTISVVDSWARPSPQDGGNGAAYAVILNGLDRPIRLVGATTAAAGSVELHETSKENDVMRMVHHPEGFEIGSGEILVLEPGGKHMMLIGLTAPLTAGESATIQLLFEGIEPMTIDVPVREPQK